MDSCYFVGTDLAADTIYNHLFMSSLLGKSFSSCDASFEVKDPPCLRSTLEFVFVIVIPLHFTFFLASKIYHAIPNSQLCAVSLGKYFKYHYCDRESCKWL